MTVTILGAGAYGLALLKMLKKNDCQITLWTKVEKEYNMLKKEGCNKFALTDYVIPDDVEITMDIKDAVKNANLIIIAVGIKYMNDVVDELSKCYKNGHICIASKGIDEESKKLTYALVYSKLKTSKISVIGGGTFATDMVHDSPMGLVVASKNKKTLKIVKQALENNILKVDTSTDILGVEIFGAVKNIIAIGCGIIDGLNYPESTKSMFFTKSFNEIIDIIYKLGGNKSTSTSYAGIGDLFLTCTSTKSRNYTFGLMIGKKNKKLEDYINNNTIEGRYTLKVFREIIHSKKIKSDLIDILYKIVYEEEDITMIINYLKR